MSTRTFIVENKLNIPVTFWEDVMNCPAAMNGFFWGHAFANGHDNIKHIKWHAFSEDNDEHIVGWMFEDWVGELFVKHRVTGYIVLDGEGSLYGVRVKDGRAHKVLVEIRIQDEL